MKALYTIHLFLFFFLFFFNFSVEFSFSQISSQRLHDFQYLNEAVDLADQKLTQTLQELAFDPTLHPAHTDPETGKWISRTRNEWTSGYFAGSLWYMYQLTGDEKWKDYAHMWTEDMKSTANMSNDHDVGLRIFGSFGNGYILTQNRQYLRAVMQGANSLASRYNSDIKAIKSWDPWESLNANYPVIIDNMMNLELLFLAAKYSEKEEWLNIAVEHAKTTYKHHFRENGSTYHIVDFDDQGNVNRKFTIQGYGPNSVWARGQGWAIYGFTMAYRYTKRPDFLEAAIKAAEYFIANLPDDNIPWYDFLEPSIPSTTKDASAASVAASGLMELYSFTDQPKYFDTSVNILSSLMTRYSSQNTGDSSILLRSTIHRGDEERGTVYADYYFLEAIKRYKEITGGIFPQIETELSFYLEQNYPNPFNSQTQFYYSVEEAGEVQIDLYNLAGKKIKTLFNGRREPGTYFIQLLDGSGLASGFYIYTLRMNKKMASKKMLHIK